MRRAVLLALIIFAVATRAHAFSAGITGFSGKAGVFCNNPGCHMGGTAPIVTIDGPTQLEINQMATFRLTVQSQTVAQIASGLDVAASSGTLSVIPGQGTQLLNKDITHVSPKSNDPSTAMATFDFTYKAPATAGTVTLFGAGNSVNLNALSTGDLAATTTLILTISKAAAAATATPTTVPPSATPTPTATTGTAPCVGDCGGDGEVTVNELIVGVNIALGSAAISACPVFDVNGDGEVTIDELLRAVNNALNSCPI